MPILSDPRAGFKAAPTSLKIAYLAMLTQSLGAFLAGVTAGRIFGGTGMAWWGMLATLVLAYLIFDSATVILKGRPMARWLTLVFSGVSLLFFAWQTYAGLGGSSVFLVANMVFVIAGILAIIAVFLPSSGEAFAAHRGEDVTAVAKDLAQTKRSSKSGKKVPSPSSREDAKQAAVDAAVAKFGPGVAEKAAVLADRVLDSQTKGSGDTGETSGDMQGIADQAALNRAQRRAMERAKRTGKAPKIVERKTR